MAQRYSVAEARSSLPTIINQAEAGQNVELTRRGTPVAVVVSCRQFERLMGARPGFGEAYRAFLKTHSLKGIGLDADFATPGREKGTGREVSL